MIFKQTGLFFLVFFTACSVNNAKKSYVLGEKLWGDGKYSVAVIEFEKAYNKDPRGRIGKQALLRAATTQAYFLSQYAEAIQKLKKYVEEGNSTPPSGTSAFIEEQQAQEWEVQKLMGDILYSKMEAYDQVIPHYRNLLPRNFSEEDRQEFLYRIGKSHFYLAQFQDAIKTFFEISKKHPKTEWGEKAAYQIGVTYFTRGEQNPGGHGPGMEAYQDAMDAFQKFIKKYPQSQLIPEAKFGIASCLEELDQLDAAREAYHEILDTYPSPKVIRIKLERIKERKAQRSR